MMSTLLFEFRAFVSVSVDTGMINFNFAVRMINFNFAVRIPLNLTNHTQGDRKTETVIRLTGPLTYTKTHHKRNVRMGQDPRLGPYRVAMIKTEAGLAFHGITSSPPLPISARSSPPLPKYPAGHAHHLPLIGHGRAGSGRFLSQASRPIVYC